MIDKECKDEILNELIENEKFYVRECNRQIDREQGKIEGAAWMLLRIRDALDAEMEEEEEEKE